MTNDISISRGGRNNCQLGGCWLYYIASPCSIQDTGNEVIRLHCILVAFADTSQGCLFRGVDKFFLLQDSNESFPSTRQKRVGNNNEVALKPTRSNSNNFHFLRDPPRKPQACAPRALTVSYQQSAMSSFVFGGMLGGLSVVYRACIGGKILHSYTTPKLS